jgi:TRAP-type C4-dicarboxylate transport system permease small subunit
LSQPIIRGYGVFQKIKWVGMMISGLTVFVMMFYTTLDVALRNIFGSSGLYAYEVSQNYFMPMTVFPALAFAFAAGMMPRIEFVVVKFNERFQKFVAIVLIIIEIILMLLLAFYGLEYAVTAAQAGESFTAGGSNYPMIYVMMFAPVAFLLVAVEMIFLLIKNIKSEKPAFTVIEQQYDL